MAQAGKYKLGPGSSNANWSLRPGPGLMVQARSDGRETQIPDKMNLMVFQNVLLSLIFSSLRFSKYSDFHFSVVIRNICVVLNNFFCFLHFYLFQNCLEVQFSSLFPKTEPCSKKAYDCLWRTCAYQEHVYLMLFYMY